jgi:hypothetical protein
MSFDFGVVILSIKNNTKLSSTGSLQSTILLSRTISSFTRRQERIGEWLLDSKEFNVQLGQQNSFCPGIPGTCKTMKSLVVTKMRVSSLLLYWMICHLSWKMLKKAKAMLTCFGYRTLTNINVGYNPLLPSNLIGSGSLRFVFPRSAKSHLLTNQPGNSTSVQTTEIELPSVDPLRTDSSR